MNGHMWGPPETRGKKYEAIFPDKFPDASNESDPNNLRKCKAQTFARREDMKRNKNEEPRERASGEGERERKK